MHLTLENKGPKKTDRHTNENKPKMPNADRRHKLNTRLKKLVTDQSPDNTEADTINRVAKTAGITPDTFREILAGNIACPPIRRLAAIAKALDTDPAGLINAAKADGCSYNAETTFYGGPTNP